MRGENVSNKMKKFCTYCQRNFFIVFSNTQLVKRWVKDSNKYTESGKDDHFASLIAMCRALTVFKYMHKSQERDKEQVLKGKKFITGEKLVKGL